MAPPFSVLPTLTLPPQVSFPRLAQNPCHSPAFGSCDNPSAEFSTARWGSSPSSPISPLASPMAPARNAAATESPFLVEPFARQPGGHSRDPVEAEWSALRQARADLSEAATFLDAGYDHMATELDELRTVARELGSCQRQGHASRKPNEVASPQSPPTKATGSDAAAAEVIAVRNECKFLQDRILELVQERETARVNAESARVNAAAIQADLEAQLSLLRTELETSQGMAIENARLREVAAERETSMQTVAADRESSMRAVAADNEVLREQLQALEGRLQTYLTKTSTQLQNCRLSQLTVLCRLRESDAAATACRCICVWRGVVLARQKEDLCIERWQTASRQLECLGRSVTSWTRRSLYRQGFAAWRSAVLEDRQRRMQNLTGTAVHSLAVADAIDRFDKDSRHNQLRIYLLTWAKTVGRDVRERQNVSLYGCRQLLLSSQVVAEQNGTLWLCRSCFAVWINCTLEHQNALRETEHSAAVAREACMQSEILDCERQLRDARTASRVKELEDQVAKLLEALQDAKIAIIGSPIPRALVTDEDTCETPQSIADRPSSLLENSRTVVERLVSELSASKLTLAKMGVAVSAPEVDRSSASKLCGVSRGMAVKCAGC